MVKCNCLHCGKSFEVWPSRIKKGFGKYCSKPCHDASQVSLIDRECLHCKSIFKVQPSRVSGRDKYCSDECYEFAKSNNTECRCEHCNEVFTVAPYRRNNAKYCSKRCYGLSVAGQDNHRWRGGKKNGRGANWSQQRKLAYERDGGVCQLCHHKPRKGERRNSVHHIKRYQDFKGDYVQANDLKNLITLCRRCHPKVEHGKISITLPMFST